MGQISTSIRLPAGLRDALARHAQGAHKSQTAVIIEALEQYLRRRDREALQAQADEEAERMNAADRRDPDYTRYLAGEENPWGEEQDDRGDWWP